MPGLSQQDGAALQVYSCNSGENQYWRVSGYTRRHVKILNVCKDNGSYCGTIPSDDASDMVAKTNELFSPFGLKLVYDPMYDVSSLYNTFMWCWGSAPCKGTALCPFGSGLNGNDCANYIADLYPHNITLFVIGADGRAPGDTSSPCQGWGPQYLHGIKLQDRHLHSASPPVIHCGNICIDTQHPSGLRDPFHLSHEATHYLGSPHAQAEANYDYKWQADNDLWIAGNNEVEEWDSGKWTNPPPGSLCGSYHCWGDGYRDTSPQPFIGDKNTEYCYSSSTSYSYNRPDGGGSFQVPINNVVSYYYHSSKQVTAGQTRVMRAQMYGRGINDGVY